MKSKSSIIPVSYAMLALLVPGLRSLSLRTVVLLFSVTSCFKGFVRVCFGKLESIRGNLPMC